MHYDPTRHNRRSIRLQHYDYTQPGAYFVTLCVQDRQYLFSRIKGGKVILNELGTIVTEAWHWLGRQYDHVDLDAYIVMPNHLHGIIILSEPGRGGSRTAPTIAHRKNSPDTHTAPATNDSGAAPPQRKPLGRLIGAFKTVSTKRINLLRQTPGAPVWQRNYWEHVIRNDSALNAVRRYINENPCRWELDPYNAEVTGVNPLAKELWHSLKISAK